ncbi:hypothetical protein AB0M54_45830 [Actinoplanes sp. NPDC051470]|uniref:hypothetical protein n=1 Tax=Actinoplanes sp. NPDC051470 TaxID=3157224 RepID=UPI0034406290
MMADEPTAFRVTLVKNYTRKTVFYATERALHSGLTLAVRNGSTVEKVERLTMAINVTDVYAHRGSIS